LNTRRAQWIVAAAALGGSAYLAYKNFWPFDSAPPIITSGSQPSLAQYFLADRVTLGFVRLAVIFLAAFVVVSVPALIIASRWIKGFSTTGLTADDAQQASEAVKELKERLAAVEMERDEALTNLEAAVATLDAVISPSAQEGG
jgi:uncharacterized membrane protein